MAARWHECGVVQLRSELARLLGEVVRVECKNYIGGKWMAAADGRTFNSADPASGEIVGTLPLSSAADVEKAVEAAARAFKSWRSTPGPKRGEILFKVGRLLQERKEALAQLVTREMGKVIAEARGDVQEAIDMTFYMAGEGRRLFGHTVPAELPNKFATSTRDPIGVVPRSPPGTSPWPFLAGSCRRLWCAATPSC